MLNTLKLLRLTEACNLLSVNLKAVRAAMKTRHLEADQWLNRKEWCLGSGRRPQLSQDRKDR